MAARATVKPTKQQPESIPLEPESGPLEERIRQRAYEIYLQHGQDGSELDDWLRAETEMTHTVEQNYFHREEAIDTISDK